MINHVRTLLMNCSRGSHRITDPGEEYIEPTFVPKAWPQALRMFRNSLFGTQPDRLFLNYRMRQLMQLIHGTVLADDVTTTDARLTYLPFKADMFEAIFATTITQPVAQESRWCVVGNPAADEYAGLTTRHWDVLVGGEGSIFVTTIGNPVVTTEHTPIESTILLPGSNLRLMIGATAGDTARISATAKPTIDIGVVLARAIAFLGVRGIEVIFPFNSTGRLAELQQIYMRHSDTLTRYAALLLAVAMHVDKLAQEGTSV